MQADYLRKTLEHIRDVQDFAVQVAYAMGDDYKYFGYIMPVIKYFPREGDIQDKFLKAVSCHDQSKFDLNEIDGYMDIMFKQKASAKFKQAVQHHYKSNPHHPEYWDKGIMEMPAEFVLEMLCDWAAASKRAGGNVLDWLPGAKERFGWIDELDEPIRNFYKYFQFQ